MEYQDELRRWAEERRRECEDGVRAAVRIDVGAEMTREALRAAMRQHTPNSYQRSVLMDSVSPLALRSEVASANHFVCCECNSHVIEFTGVVREPPLCAHCLCLPGWFEVAAIRDALDPTFLSDRVLQ